MKKIIEHIKALNGITKKLIIAAIIVAVLLLVVLVIFSGSGKTTISVETSLKEIIKASDLATAKYTYNSIAEVKDGDTTKYYVSYKGTVSAGLDFEKVKVERDGNTIQIIVPEIEILSVNVDEEMNYIFTKKKYDTESTYAEAYNICTKDLEEKAKTNQTLLETAKQSAEDTIMALIKPIEGQLNEGEIFEIVFEQEMEGTAQ